MSRLMQCSPASQQQSPQKSKEAEKVSKNNNPYIIDEEEKVTPRVVTEQIVRILCVVGFIFTDHNLTSYRERYVFDRVSTFKRLPTVR